MMDAFDRAAQGFAGLPFEAQIKDRALKFLKQWLTEPEFAPYVPQIERLVESEKWLALLDRFYQILPFGTGGRRGAVGIGPNRMNLWTLGASVQGHCEFLKQRFPGIDPLRVVLAYDVRCFADLRKNYAPELPNPILQLSSRDMANHAAGVYGANGIQAYLLPAESSFFVATPELSFTIRHLAAHGGLNISASHNPPDDNGGKFYDEHGGQPVPPDDQIMADLVDQVVTIKSIPWTECLRAGRTLLLDRTAHEAYIDLCRRQSIIPPPKPDELTVVFTPLHGVGAMTAMETLVGQGFHVVPVAEQMKPDGLFPNVTKSPNPEVPESMDRAIATAQRHQADLILSTDPDADRLGCMIPDCSDESRYEESTRTAWRFVTGNEIAALLTHFKLEQLARQGSMPSSPIVVKTDVTTSLITRIARHFNAQVVENLLVGFKYIADVLWQLEQHGVYEDVEGTTDDFVIGVEESHGVLVTPNIRDKDAAGGALLLAELTLDQRRQGKTVLGYLQAIQRQFGYFRNDLALVVMPGLEGKQNLAKMLDRLRSSPPKEIGGLPVTSVADLADERGRLGSFKGATDRASRNVITFHLGDRARIALRPSGTEPKAKAYVEVCSSPCPPGATAEAWQKTRAEVDALADRLGKEFLQIALGQVGLRGPQ